MKQTLITSLILSAMISSPNSWAFLKLDSNNHQDIASLVNSNLLEIKEHSALVDQIKTQLPISEQQASGGIAALFALANNQLTESHQTELSHVIPSLDTFTQLGLSPTGTSPSSLTTLEEVNAVFNQLGLDSSMVEQFAPVLLQYLTQQNAGTDLLQTLQGLWR